MMSTCTCAARGSAARTCEILQREEHVAELAGMEAQPRRLDQHAMH